VSPNPVRAGFVTMRMREGGTAVLCDAAGRRLLDLKPGRNDLRSLAPGVYFVRTAGGPGYASKVVVGRLPD
jgi:hypothetical protein